MFGTWPSPFVTNSHVIAISRASRPPLVRLLLPDSTVPARALLVLMKLWRLLLSLALYVFGVNGLQSCKLPVSRVARSRGTLSGLSAHSKLANTKE